MSAIAFQITGVWIVYSTVRSKETPKLHVAGLCDGNSPVTQRVCNAEMFPFDDVIMNDTISNHFVNHKLLYNEKSVLGLNTVEHESSQCK